MCATDATRSAPHHASANRALLHAHSRCSPPHRQRTVTRSPRAGVPW
ncbi:hypothetical protein ACFPRL_30145 [Pseudoclavibacter helvolus]